MLVQLGLSLAAVLAVAGLARWLGLGGGGALDEAEAMARAEALVPGFEAVGARLLGDGHAEVTGADGRAVRLRPLGAHWVADG